MTSYREEPLLTQILFFVIFVTDRSVMLQLMEALVPGRAGPRVATATRAAGGGPACAGPGLVIAPPLSVAASSATASALKSPTAPGISLWSVIGCDLQDFLHSKKWFMVLVRKT